MSAHLTADGPAALIFRPALSRYFECYFSHALRQEYFEVLRREQLKLDAGEIARSLHAFSAAAFVVTPRTRICIARDPDDDKVLECATEAKADYIVTGNIRDSPPSFETLPLWLHAYS